jgi:chromosome segregation ATPase
MKRERAQSEVEEENGKEPTSDEADDQDDELTQLENNEGGESKKNKASKKTDKKKRWKLASARIDRLELQMLELREDQARDRRRSDEVLKQLATTNEKVDNTTNDRISNEKSLQDLNKTVDSINARVQTLSGDIGECNRRLQKLGSETELSIAKLEGLVKDLEGAIHNATGSSEEFARLNRTIDAIRGQIHTSVERIDDHNVTITKIGKQLSEEIAGRNGAEKKIKEALDGLEASLIASNDKFHQLAGRTQSSSFKLEQIGKEVDANGARMSALVEEELVTKKDVEELKQDVSDSDSKMELLEKTIGSITLRLDQIEKDSAALYRRAQALDEL